MLDLWDHYKVRENHCRLWGDSYK